MSELMMKYFAEDDTIVMSSDSKRRLVAQDYEAILLCVRQAIADEREACAKIVDSVRPRCADIAAAIRARGETT